jgi:hypothetical protein
MDFYKLTKDTVVSKYNPEKKNVYGGVGVEFVKYLKKGDIVLVNRVEPNDIEKDLIKAENYFISRNNFISVSQYTNQLTDSINTKDIITFAYEKAKEPKSIVIIGVLIAIIIGTKALIKNN